MGDKWSEVKTVSWRQHQEANYHPQPARPLVGVLRQASDIKEAFTGRQPNFLTLSTIFVCVI